MRVFKHLATVLFVFSGTHASARTYADHMLSFRPGLSMNIQTTLLEDAPSDRRFHFTFASEHGTRSYGANTWLDGWNGGFERQFALLTYCNGAMEGAEWDSLMELKKEIAPKETGYDAALMDRFSYYLRDQNFKVRIRKLGDEVAIFRIGDEFPIELATEQEELARGSDFNEALGALLADRYPPAELKANRGGLKQKLANMWRRHTR